MPVAHGAGCCHISKAMTAIGAHTANSTLLPRLPACSPNTMRAYCVTEAVIEDATATWVYDRPLAAHQTVNGAYFDWPQRVAISLFPNDITKGDYRLLACEDSHGIVSINRPNMKGQPNNAKTVGTAAAVCFDCVV